MTVRLTRWRGMIGRTALLAAAVALIPMPVAASGTKSAPKAPQVSLRQVVAKEAAHTPLRTSTASTAKREQDNQTKQSPGFFRTPAGMAALAVMAIGTGYAIYSTQHDRIHSPGKK